MRRGFTLVEFLCCVAIMFILATMITVAATKYGRHKNKGRIQSYFNKQNSRIEIMLLDENSDYTPKAINFMQNEQLTGIIKNYE